MAVDYTDGAGTVGSGSYRDGIVMRGPEEHRAAPRPGVVVAVAAPQSTDRQRFVVEKLAELGVDELVWLRTAHGGHRTPPPGKARSWAVGALEQSRGAHLMAVGGPVDLGGLAERGVVRLADPGGGPLEPGPDPLVLAIGPEGGFAAAELDGVTRFGLGARILRVETAAVTAAVVALHATGRLASGGR